ncbi:unnamed protein product [Penicillium nalgiovense]|nr:unnamed protein product [Penicillium nalgiovense]
MYWLENITLRFIEGFIRWYLDEHNEEYHSSLMTVVRFFRMYWSEETGRELSRELGQDVTALSNDLSKEYGLNLGAKQQPPFSINELLLVTHHLLDACDMAFPTFRCLLQLNTLRKMMASTSARPGTLTLSTGYMRGNDALKWKDIELFMVKDPEDPGSQILLMKVQHRLNKGRRNEGAPPKFMYTERNDSLGLCVIHDILTYAFLDDAFASPYIKCPRDIWRLTKIPEHRQSTPIHFKESLGDIPVLRRAMRTDNGSWVTDPENALLCSQAQSWEQTACEKAGFPDKGSLYKYRKGAAVNLRHLDEHSRNAVMGHRKGGTFASYVSVLDDTQSIYMGTPTRDSLLNLAIHANLKRDASAPHDLSIEQKESLEMDSELRDLRKAHKSLRITLIAEFRHLQKAREANDARWHEYTRLQNKTWARQRKLYRKAKKTARDEFFQNIGNQIIERNHQGNPIIFTPDTSHIQPERRALSRLEFKNRDVDTLSDAELLEDRIQSLELRLKLHSLHVPRTLKKRIKFGQHVSKEAGATEDFRWKYPKKAGTDGGLLPSKSSTGLECPVCLGRNDLHPSARTYPYARKDVLKRHFETHKLPFVFNRDGRQCDYPGCLEVLFTLARYKIHLEDEHNISL